MRELSGICVLGLIAIVLPSVAMADVMIDFDSAPDLSAFGNQFESLGIVEVDPGLVVTDAFTSFPGTTIPSGSQMLSLRTSDGFAELKFVSTSDPNIDGFVDSFQFSRPGDNGSGFYEGMIVEAVNGNGDLVDQVTAPAIGPGDQVPVKTYLLTGSGIRLIRFTLVNNPAGEGGNPIDDFVFPEPTPIPEPASLALLGLGGVALLRRTRRER